VPDGMSEQPRDVVAEKNGQWSVFDSNEHWQSFSIVDRFGGSRNAGFYAANRAGTLISAKARLVCFLHPWISN